MTTKRSFTLRVENKKASVSQLFIKKTLDHKFEKKSPIERIVNTNQFAFSTSSVVFAVTFILLLPSKKPYLSVDSKVIEPTLASFLNRSN